MRVAVLVGLLPFALSGCGLTAAQITADVGNVGTALCDLGAVITHIADPTGTENQVLAVVCRDIAPVVSILGSAAAGKPHQCAKWDVLDDSRRYGGDGKRRPNQLICSDLKLAVEEEIAKPPAARRSK